MTQQFTMEQTLAWLRQAVQERGEDFNYCQTYKRGNYAPETWGGGCKYVETGTDGEREPGCIAGQVFNYAGANLASLDCQEGTSADMVAPKFGFSKPAAKLLREAQAVQDRGRTWGEALAAAETWHRGYLAAADAASFNMSEASRRVREELRAA